MVEKPSENKRALTRRDLEAEQRALQDEINGLEIDALNTEASTSQLFRYSDDKTSAVKRLLEVEALLEKMPKEETVSEREPTVDLAIGSVAEEIRRSTELVVTAEAMVKVLQRQRNSLLAQIEGLKFDEGNRENSTSEWYKIGRELDAKHGQLDETGTKLNEATAVLRKAQERLEQVQRLLAP